MENEAKPMIDQSTTVLVVSESIQKDTSTLKRINKLIGQKSIQLAKEEALDETATINESDLDLLLSPDDKKFYQVKRKAYLTSYPEMADDQFDLDNLHLMIMEQISQRGLLKKKKKHPALDISKDHDASTKKQLELQKTLNVRRTDRMKSKGERKVENSFANISVHFNSPDKLDELNREIIDMRAEEETLRLKKGIE